MLQSSVLEALFLPLGVLYFFLHAGPLFRLWYEPSIRGGTSWKFFGSEVLLAIGWMLCSPTVWESALGRVVVFSHLGAHIAFAVLDRFHHAWTLRSALSKPRSGLGIFLAKELGLFIDTALHGTLVVLAAWDQPFALLVAVIEAALLGYLGMTAFFTGAISRVRLWRGLVAKRRPRFRAPWARPGRWRPPMDVPASDPPH